MNELFLYYVWEHRLMRGMLFTIDGETIDILNTGYRNTDSGPDYKEARIKIGATEWVGNVEIHVRTSDWKKHRHHHDKAYDSVVLHVVYEHDMVINDIPVLELKGSIDPVLLTDYQRFVSSQGWISCERSVKQIHRFSWNCWFERLALERLECKIKLILVTLKKNNYDWEETFYQLTMRCFGLKVNAEAFESLAKVLPLKNLLKHADNLLQVEAMMFGCSGLLENMYHDEYPRLLEREFCVMKAKFGLVSLKKEYWHYLRMRPSNFPTIRIAQMAMLIHQNREMFSKTINAQSIQEVEKLFRVKASSYWETHFRFDIETEHKERQVGSATINSVIINVVVPILFCYGKLHKDTMLCEKALEILGKTKPEDNTIVRSFSGIGLKPTNALQSQAMLQLYNCYCRRRRCLDCMAGITLIGRKK